MPYELSDLIARRVRTVEIAVTDTESLAVRYSPDAMTPEVWARLQGWIKGFKDQEADVFDIARHVIVPLMRSWDLTVGGEPYPITVENVAALGLPLAGSISNAIMVDFNNVRDMTGPKERSAALSSVPSTPAADSPIGTSP